MLQKGPSASVFEIQVRFGIAFFLEKKNVKRNRLEFNIRSELCIFEQDLPDNFHLIKVIEFLTQY